MAKLVTRYFAGETELQPGQRVKVSQIDKNGATLTGYTADVIVTARGPLGPELGLQVEPGNVFFLRNLRDRQDVDISIVRE
jgi:hypothetical protein